MNRECGNGLRWRGRMHFATRAVLAGLFIYAGVIKLMKPDLFLADIESYRLVPYSLAWLTAFYLPPLEILCGIGLLLPKLHKPAGLIMLGLILVFLIAIISAWGRGLDISCGCFGATSEATNYVWLVGRDLLIAGALLYALFGANFNKVELPVVVSDME
jgi:putative oxidoreductase